MKLAIAVPAMAVDINVVNNDDGTITVQYSATPGENLRGVGIVLTLADCTVSAEADIWVNPEFNVRFDEAYDAEQAVPSSYILGTGSCLAKVNEPGVLTLADGDVSQVAISLGVLKPDQGAASAGTNIDLVKIALDGLCDGTAPAVAVALDPLRGGIVGDAVTVGTLATGVAVTDTVNCSIACFGDFNGDGYVDAIDVQLLIPVFGTTCP